MFIPNRKEHCTFFSFYLKSDYKSEEIYQLDLMNAFVMPQRISGPENYTLLFVVAAYMSP